MQKASTRKFHAASSRQIRQSKGLTADPQAVVLLGSPGRQPITGLCRFSARGHRSEIMLGVLVVVFCPDYIAGLGLGLG
jgi:hypothetical protein